MAIWRILLAVLAVLFAILIVWAIRVGDFSAAGSWLTSDPWGIVTLADLYFGFLLAAIVIGTFEKGWRAVLWIAPIPFLGNVWTAIWFVVRLPRLVQAISKG